MKKLRVEEAVGQVLCHDLTRIVPGTMKGPQFRKGHIIAEGDIPMLRSMGKEHLFVWEKREGMLHENEAALRLAALCTNAHIRSGVVAEGKIEVFAEMDGVFCADVARLNRVNAVPEVVIAARHSYSAVKAGDKLAAMKVVPLVVAEAILAQAEAAAGTQPLFALRPYSLKTAWVISTGSEVAQGLIPDRFTPVIMDKLKAYGIRVIRQVVVGDDEVLAAIQTARKGAGGEKPELILCTGGMSVDPDDNTPGAIKESGAEIVTYGAPVVPGVMFLLGYYAEGIPVLGLPGCVMYMKATIFDLVLPRIAAGVRMRKQDFTVLGNGGLCLGCPECRYPVCPFGRV
ncbi:MAG: molybdopterin-binding protein [Spirochaetaceae bacterium]|jgi:molybdopterin biosynthesis enzyme|nr:molybdopterin-binding protein [Spirochaetaceae bacterium]